MLLIAVLALVGIAGVAVAVRPDAPSSGEAFTGRIAFVRSSGRDADVFVIDPATGAERQVTHGPGTRSAPAWSPDGRRLALVRRQSSSGGFNLYAMPALGGPQLRLTDGLWIDGNPSWSPDGSAVAFDSNRDGGQVAIYLVGPTGGDPAFVTHGQAPSWSPSGGRVAFMRLEGETFDAFTMRPDGTGVRNLTVHPSDDMDPCWSPDGLRIAFASDRGGDFDIYVLDPTDGSVEAVTTGPEDDRHPTWSPDGSSIAFARSGGEVASSAIFVAQLSSGRVVRMTSSPLYDVTPTWGP